MTFCLGLIINTIAFAQNNTTAKTETEKEKAKPEKPFAYVSFSGGISVPLGDFAATGSGKDYNGFASLGGLTRLRFAIPIGRKGMGISISTNSTFNPFNAQTYAEEISKRTNGQYYVRTSATSYITSSLSVGYFGTSDFNSDWFHLDGWINASLVSCSPPQVKVSLNEVSREYKTDPALGFGAELGMAARFDVASRLALMIEAEGTYREFKFNGDIDGKQYQYRLNFSAGIAVRMGRN